MLKSLTILLCLFQFFTDANCQDQTVIRVKDDGGQQLLTQDTWYFADTAYHTIEEITANPGKFIFKKANVSFAYSIGFTKSYYWFRLTLKNLAAQNKTYKLGIGKISLHHIELFACNKNQSVSLGVTGINYPFYQRPYPSNYFIYPIEISANDTITYYAVIDNRNYDTQVGFFLFNEFFFKIFEQRTYFCFGIISGIFLLVFAFNLLFYLFTFQSFHLWYALYIIFSVWQVLSYEGFDYQFFFPENTVLMSMARSLTTQLFFICILILMPKYIGQNKSNSRYYLLTIFFKWLMIVFTSAFVLLSTFTNSYSINYFFSISVKVLYLAGSLIMINSCIEQYKNGTKVALFFLMGLIIYLLGTLDYVLFMLKVTDYVNKFPSLFQLFSVIEVIILSYGILYRYNTYRKEKDKLAQIVVDTKLAVSHQLLQTQEAERKRIAEDLHDELGSSLAALKLQLQKSSLPGEELESVLNVVNKASADTRNISHNLMPPQFEKTQLNELLSDYYSKLNSEAGIKFEFHSSGNNQHFTKEDELIIYRIVMELTGNILKHSQADEATIQMIYSEQSLDIMAEDNGIGIIKNETDGIGLKNIQSRVSYLKGEIHIDSNENGTTVIIKIPYKNI